jgi:hypothetical protein
VAKLAVGLVRGSAFRHAVLAGALITSSLVPAAALVGMGQVAEEMVMALEALGGWDSTCCRWSCSAVRSCWQVDHDRGGRARRYPAGNITRRFSPRLRNGLTTCDPRRWSS